MNDVSRPDHDVVVVGSGPNGLAAAVSLARAGLSVLVLEQHEQVGGGTRTAALTLPGFAHDVCSTVHPLGVISAFMRSVPLGEHGLAWATARYSVAHPFDDGEAVTLQRSLDETAAELGADARAYRRLFAPFVRVGVPLFADLLGPLGRVPRHPFAMARFGFYGLRSAERLARRFEGRAARALLAGNAAHHIMPLTMAPTASAALLFTLSGHCVDWPVARGGSQAIADALASVLRGEGGEIRTGTRVRSLADLPAARAYVFDVLPKQLLEIAGDALPDGYRRKLARYHYGPAVFKVDWALSGEIPWKHPRCREAATVHVGGTFEEIADSEQAAWSGEHHPRPFLILAQQSVIDPSRAPAGQHTVHAYCHVPFGSTVDMTDRIEAQIERFAPGFRELVLARHTRSPAELEAENPSMVGGVLGGGAANLRQLFTRPVARLDPYSTPHPKIFLCSGATPPGGGVHGLCGAFAAESVLRRLGGSTRLALRPSA